MRADGVFASYAHLDKIYIKNKQLVKKGELIGLEGSTGLAGSRHLYFSLNLLGADSDFFNVHKKTIWICCKCQSKEVKSCS